jgi:ribonuclease R
VHVTSLPKDYYHFDPVGHRMSGERSGRVYRLGDRLRVKAARVDLDERKIDFETVDMPVRRARKRMKARGR